MSGSLRFHYVVVASHEDTGESIAAGAIGPASIQALITEFRALGFERVQVIETTMPQTPAEAARRLYAMAAE